MNASDSPVVKRILAKLEALYPEHKVFALSSLDDDLRETLNNAYQSLGYSSMDDLLGDLGYERISASAVRDLRSEVLYSPGSEPEPIRSKIVNARGLLEEYYPGGFPFERFAPWNRVYQQYLFAYYRKLHGA